MTTFSRAKRGLRDDLRVHIVAVASLAIAFLCLGGALLAITNLSHMSDRWGRSRNVSVYLKDSAKDADIAQLRMLLENVDDIASSTLTSSAEARRQFAQNADIGIAVDSLPVEAFPASLELTLKPGTTAERVAQLAARVGRLTAVDAVETYQTWFGQLTALVSAGRTASLALALLVMVCVVAVVGSTIRLAVTGRRQEIEVLKLCGATDSFVRGPFVVEGALQSASAALLAVILLSVGYLALHARIDATTSSLIGVSTVFLNPLWLVAMVIGGGLIGALGSMFSVRRYLSV